MKTSFSRFCACALLLLLPLLPHAVRAQGKGYLYMQMTTIESVVAGGLGRSRVMFTPEFKGTKETPMENLFSLTGINMSNVRANEETILRYLGEITTDGWELFQVTPLTQTLQSGGSTNQGIFMTRYTFRKAK
ncbi:hypothetical protein F0P96_15660 [Hymenobacter busanensis]|uniref:Uncharacterized protein n=1 Tax=Hymenobacter busanensis TaxID=2607656 RepID=A0A7L5A431_9BACT|nr:hypothetical protein [Hymenobacter busanensis]KAA9331668.1 hypothetical protein F0P96_15660 [Hymenobacter busanensis]QHJ08820.1 hypothetical protein GUY19_16600 [Hymenobacter busanensis]